MKTRLFYTVLTIGILIATLSCSKDDDSVAAAPTYAELIIGNWNLEQVGTINRVGDITLAPIPDCSLESIVFFNNGTCRITACFDGEPLIATLTWELNGSDLFLQSVEFSDITSEGFILSLDKNTLEIRTPYNNAGVADYEFYTR